MRSLNKKNNNNIEKSTTNLQVDIKKQISSFDYEALHKTLGVSKNILTKIEKKPYRINNCQNSITILTVLSEKLGITVDSFIEKYIK